MTHDYICPLCTERAHYNRSPRIADYICGNKKCLGFMKPLPNDVDCDCCPTPVSDLKRKLDRSTATLSIELGKALRNL